ncbi:hypothetical protein ABZV24_19470 [Streptomyces sp. NPDC005251]|uniref:hypothetical protein n=1 Tax=Streptomyces sp. NPDC005251 TaxID=3157166 RepID=UPI0033A59D5D
MTEPDIHFYAAANPEAVDADSLSFNTAKPTGSAVIAIIDRDRHPVHIRIGTCHCRDHPQRGPGASP